MHFKKGSCQCSVMLSSIKVQGALHERCMQYYSKLQIWFWDIIEDFNDNPYRVTFQGEIQLFFKFISRCKKIFRLYLYTFSINRTVFPNEFKLRIVGSLLLQIGLLTLIFQFKNRMFVGSCSSICNSILKGDDFVATIYPSVSRTPCLRKPQTAAAKRSQGWINETKVKHLEFCRTNCDIEAVLLLMVDDDDYDYEVSWNRRHHKNSSRFSSKNGLPLWAGPSLVPWCFFLMSKSNLGRLDNYRFEYEG